MGSNIKGVGLEITAPLPSSRPSVWDSNSFYSPPIKIPAWAPDHVKEMIMSSSKGLLLCLVSKLMRTNGLISEASVLALPRRPGLA